MRFLLLYLIVCLSYPAFCQSDSSFNYYQSSNNRYIVEIKSDVAYSYRAKVSPESIEIYFVDTLPNVLTDSTSKTPLPLFYSDGWMSVEKRGPAYFLIRTNSEQKPREPLDLNPIMEQQEMEKAINNYQRYWFRSTRLKDLEDEFPDYDGYWDDGSIEDVFDDVPLDLPREQYLGELKRHEKIIYDSIRELNIKYKNFIDRIGEEPVTLTETKALYTEINSREYDFIGYRNHLINKLIDNQPELYFGLAGSIESKDEREDFYLSMTRKRYLKLKATEADADLKTEFRRAHRNNTITNIGLYTLESIFTLVATWLLSI